MNDLEERDLMINGSTPHLLGRPLLFQIKELEHPETDIVLRWIVSFYVSDAPEFVFDLRKGAEHLTGCLGYEGYCYELLENGGPCSFGRWHLGPETARNSIVAVVEDYVQRQLLRHTPRPAWERTGGHEQYLHTAFLRSMSTPGLEVLSLFRTGCSPSL